MYTLFTILALLLSGEDQLQKDAKPQQTEKTYTLHGKILEDVRSYGGMYREYDPELNTVPAHGMKLKVVKLDKKKPKVMGIVKGDVNGRFSVDLPPGTYGFIGEDEKPNAENFLPSGYQKDEEHYTRSSTWTSNIEVPVVIKDEDIVGLHLINQRTSSCKRCP